MTDTELTLVKNDGSEVFHLKATDVTTSVSMGLVQKAILSAVGGLTGGDPTLSSETVEVNGVIKGTEAVDYPNAGTYSDHDLGMAEELRRAAKEWRPTTGAGLNTMQYDYDDRGLITGVFTDLQITENRESDAPRDYTFTIEWTHYDVYVG